MKTPRIIIFLAIIIFLSLVFQCNVDAKAMLFAETEIEAEAFFCQKSSNKESLQKYNCLVQEGALIAAEASAFDLFLHFHDIPKEFRYSSIFTLEFFNHSPPKLS